MPGYQQPTPPGLFRSQGSQVQYGKMTPGFPVSQDGKLFFDPTTGKLIPKNQQRSADNFMNNPYGFNLGNVVMPWIDYSPLKKISNITPNAGGSFLG